MKNDPCLTFIFNEIAQHLSNPTTNMMNQTEIKKWQDDAMKLSHQVLEQTAKLQDLEQEFDDLSQAHNKTQTHAVKLTNELRLANTKLDAAVDIITEARKALELVMALAIEAAPHQGLPQMVAHLDPKAVEQIKNAIKSTGGNI